MPQRPPDRLLAGSPVRLGAHWDGLGVNFAVFSANASAIDLCLFDPGGRKEVARLAMPECTDEVWHGHLPDAEPGLVYGYRAHGPYEPQHGHRFNPNKLLLDPYARQIQGSVRWNDALFGYRLNSPRGDLVPDRRDSAPAMPKAVVVDESFDWGDERAPNTPWNRTVIYEAHVRGVSMQRTELRVTERGTLRALANPCFIEHLQKLQVTAVELLPIHAYLQDRFLVERGLRNYWGYSTLAFFAPEPAYLATGLVNEFRVAVRRLHAAGIEVLLDVVYNHTCEGSELGPTLSWRGLDNASYYRLVPGNERHTINDTGCGNTVNLSHPRVLQMVMDSLRHWVQSYHVDGFRFDLGVTLGREGTGFDCGSGFFDAIRQDPVLAGVKLISEPWDLGPGGYQLGRHPPGFAEWNDKYRDTVRGFWRGDAGTRGDLAARLAGSADLFDHRRRKPWSSVNFVTAHDGFTLRDVVSYATKHNDANGEGNRDGTDHNHSGNWSAGGRAEGDTDDPLVNATRLKVQRAMLATLLFSQGTPMLLGGDEFGRSQRGNNNAYCQDNPISWFDWGAAARSEAATLTEFVGGLVALRHRLDAVRPDAYLHSTHEHAPGVHDMDWFDCQGEVLTSEGWSDPQARTLILRRAARPRDRAGRPQPHVDLVLLLFNAHHEAIDFRLPAPAPAVRWRRLVDTATGSVHRGDRRADAQPTPGRSDAPYGDDPAAPLCEHTAQVDAHSLVLLGGRLALDPGITA